MLEIKGKVNTAICYASVIEEEAIEQIRRMCDYEFTAGIEQIRRMCDYEFTAGSRIRIMPDVHAGKGCTIGTTMTITDKAVPNIVGVDIGCGMYTIDLGKTDIDYKKLDEAAHFIPSGMNVWEGRQEHFDLEQLRGKEDRSTLTSSSFAATGTSKTRSALSAAWEHWGAETISSRSMSQRTEKSIWSSTAEAAISENRSLNSTRSWLLS